MGISEQARNITDTSLKRVLTTGDDPAAALKDHVLRLESSLRDLSAAEDQLSKQCAWLSSNIDRNLKLAETSDSRAARLAELHRDEDARQALADKHDSLIHVTADRKRLLHLESSLPDIRRQLAELRGRIAQAKTIRARLAAGQPLREEDFHRPTDTRRPEDPS